MDGAMLVGVAIATVLIVWLARIVARGSHEVPTAPPAWAGPDCGLLEEALRKLLVERAASSTLGQVPELSELARHHAFSMAARNFTSGTDPEGIDHQERRRRLHPVLVGRTSELVGSFEPLAGQSPEAFARAFVDANEAALDVLLSDEYWSALGLGVSVEAGRGAVCLVAGEVWAQLIRKASWGPDSGWTCEGKTVEGVQSHDLSARLVCGQRPEDSSPATIELDWKPERFRLQVEVTDLNDDCWIEILRQGRPGLRKRIR